MRVCAAGSHRPAMFQNCSTLSGFEKLVLKSLGLYKEPPLKLSDFRRCWSRFRWFCGQERKTLTDSGSSLPQKEKRLSRNVRESRGKSLPALKLANENSDPAGLSD
jgi:hypothetical protein